MERVFEVGNIFHERERRVYELFSVAFLVFIPDRTTSWKKREAFDFYSAKSIMEALAKAAGLDIESIGYRTVDGGGSLWLQSHSASVGP